MTTRNRTRLRSEFHMKKLITRAELLRLLSYNPETGEFHHKARRSGVTAGMPAGSIDPGHRYVRINLSRRLYLAHRLAWFYVHGEWPVAEIDHIDGNRANNRIANLRQATRSENQRNKPVYRNNKTGIKGVCWHKQHRKFIATIHVNKRAVHVGLFTDLNEAARAYRDAAERLHGNFARCA